MLGRGVIADEVEKEYPCLRAVGLGADAGAGVKDFWFEAVPEEAAAGGDFGAPPSEEEAEGRAGDFAGSA